MLPAATRRPGRRAAVVSLLAVCLALAGCRSRPRPSILWIVVDTLRADHLRPYGYGRQTSASLQPLVERGVLFENAFTPQPVTTPALAAALTGLYPPHHGLRALYWRLHDSNVTVAERLRLAGYDTAAFVSSFVMVDDFNNFSQGFDLYDDRVTERELYRENYERKAEATVARARHWLRERSSEKPFFVFLHLIDPHGPYAPPEEWARRFRSTEPVKVAGAIPSYQQIPGVDDLNVYRDRYDGEIAYAIEELGHVLDDLQGRGELDPALVVFTADHGESLGERGIYFRHGTDVFQENVHVPLVIKPPGGAGLRAGARVATPVSLVDLLPTTLELAELKVSAGFDGISLVPALAGRPLPPRQVMMWAPTGSQISFAAVEGNRKSMVRRPRQDGRAWVSTFDLAADPGERHPHHAERQLARQLRHSFDGWLHATLPFRPRQNFLAEAQRGDFVRRRLDARQREDIERLRSLGYLQ